MLVVIAYAVLKFWRIFQNVSWTIGETVCYIQGSRLFDDSVITLVEETNP